MKKWIKSTQNSQEMNKSIRGEVIANRWDDAVSGFN